MTLTSKKRVHSLSGISKKSCGPKMPTLFTRTSAEGSALSAPRNLDRAKIGGHAVDLGAGHGLLQRRERGIHAGLVAAVDHDPGARLGETLGDGEADAYGRAAVSAKVRATSGSWSSHGSARVSIAVTTGKTPNQVSAASFQRRGTTSCRASGARPVLVVFRRGRLLPAVPQRSSAIL
jgi:hypothetical protein